MFFIVFKCTRSEREGLMDPSGYWEPERLDCYMVSNKFWQNATDAKNYAAAMPVSRQARVVQVTEFRCPQTGKWLGVPDANHG